MSGILVYTKQEAERNSFSIEKFKQKLNILLVDEGYNGDADYVINRTNDYHVAERFEQRGIRVFNNSLLSRLANDKQACYDFMEQHGIPVMETRYTGIPAVKKAVGGHGGTEVYMLNTAEKHEKGYVYQKPCDTLGRDLRVWLIGGEIIASVLRESDTDFRSNFCLGGRAVPYNLSEEEKSLVKKIYDLSGGDYIGVDFLFNNGSLVFNEIEDTVGARMVYSKTNIDIISLYCDYIIKEMNNE
ncbi:MAG: ATP-grasp domain-containing protein [Acetobacter sp.]|nr:ATP-grasp domain-containing protein [Bacteroides sp.]MCM1341962.1 ATP-grasp domain-containing protein [Acetobacter sp.]MCM1434147.1 ATP-grasp domain-containing protein [Clostridiales bacterium]